MNRVALPDGRTLEYLDEGHGLPLVMHHGTPSAAVRLPTLFDAVTARGLRIIVPSRPGYGDSTPQPGRRVADAAADVAALLDALGATDFVTVGWSGGGPHALACAALLPDRCRGAVSIAGLAPYRAEGLDWLAGMGDENVVEFTAAATGTAELTAFLTAEAAGLATVGPAEVAASLGGLLSEVDRRALTDEMATFLADSFRRAVAPGVAGWRDDDVAFASDWGFDVAGIRPPVHLWQGDEDRMVPLAHGRWLADRLPGSATAHLLPGEGHISLITHLPAMLDALVIPRPE